MRMDVKTIGTCYRALLIALAIQGLTPDLHDVASAILPCLFSGLTSGPAADGAAAPLSLASIGHDPSDACMARLPRHRPRIRIALSIPSGHDFAPLGLCRLLPPPSLSFSHAPIISTTDGRDLNRSLCRFLC